MQGYKKFWETTERSPSSCYSCGGKGHFARECTAASKVLNMIWLTPLQGILPSFIFSFFYIHYFVSHLLLLLGFLMVLLISGYCLYLFIYLFIFFLLTFSSVVTRGVMNCRLQLGNIPRKKKATKDSSPGIKVLISVAREKVLYRKI